jgi:hypothetical protein
MNFPAKENGPASRPKGVFLFLFYLVDAWATYENGLFLSFPYVCPEPVLVKRWHLYINGSKRPFCTHRRPPR